MYPVCQIQDNSDSNLEELCGGGFLIPHLSPDFSMGTPAEKSGVNDMYKTWVQTVSTVFMWYGPRAYEAFKSPLALYSLPLRECQSRRVGTDEGCYRTIIKEFAIID